MKQQTKGSCHLVFTLIRTLTTTLIRPLSRAAITAGTEKAIEITRIRATAAAIRIIQGIRYVFVIHYFFLLASFVGSMGLFFSAYLISIQLNENQNLHFTWPLGTCAILFLISTLIFIFTLREKTWIRVFQIDKMVDAALDDLGESRTTKNSEITPEMIADIVEKTLEKKFKNLHSLKG